MRLRVLYDEIDARVADVLAREPTWPCRRGCDDCCRSLAEPPRVGEQEWSALSRAIAALDDGARAAVARGFAELAAQTHKPFICPLLDRATGACRVYDARPAVCRAYGFYVSRGDGTWCRTIESRVAEGASVVFGNHDALEREVARADGAPRSFVEWWSSNFRTE